MVFYKIDYVPGVGEVHIKTLNLKKISVKEACRLNEKIKDAGGVLKLYQETMGIYHTDDRLAIAEAVPPVYSEYIGREFFRLVHPEHLKTIPNRLRLNEQLGV